MNAEKRSAYKIFEQNGEYGLLYQPFPDEPGQVFLDPVYDSLQIESDYFDLDHFYATSDETKFSRPDFEHNCAIVIANRQAGLVIGKKNSCGVQIPAYHQTHLLPLPLQR